MHAIFERFRSVGTAGMLAVAAAAFGCQPKAAAPPAAPLPILPVSTPVSRMVTDTVDFTGRTDAVESVSLKARVTGYLIKRPPKEVEGTEVKEGDLLFEIDPRPYQVLVDQAVANVVVNQAAYDLAQQTLGRDRTLGGAVSQQQLDQDKATLDQAAARVKAAQAAVETAKLNLEFCRVTSPITGRLSRSYYTVGNLVTQDSTLLTTIVSQDPMYIYFDLDERTMNKLNQQIADRATAKTGESSADSAAAELPVSMALEGETGFPHTGTIDFINNQFNPSTGTIAVRGVFRNQKLKGGPWLITPGKFVRVRLPVTAPHKVLLVVDKAIQSDQGIKYVYVVDAENKAQYRKVVTGALQEDGLRVVEDYKKVKNADGKDEETGLKPDDRVVVAGIQSLRPKTEIQPVPTPMPTVVGGGVERKVPPPPGAGEKGAEKKPKK